MSPGNSPARRRTGLARKVLVGAGATAAAGALGYAGARHLIRRARSGSSPESDEDLAERPGIERRIVSFDGTELAVNVLGPDRRPRLVMLHGFSGDLTLWHYQWTHFSKDFRCVLFDHRGHGRSGPAAQGDYSLEALGRDLKAVLDAEAGDAPVALIGHSMGGMAVLSFAQMFPEEFGARVRAVVLANTAASDLVKAMVAGLGAYAGRFLAAAASRVASKPDRVYRIRARALAGRGDLAFLATRLANFGPNAPPSLVEYVAEVGARAPVEVWSDLLASLVGMDLGDAMECVRVPVLIVVGDVDRLTPPSSATAMRHRLPDARVVVVEGAGHCTMLERHAEFNSAVERFLHEALQPVVGPPPARARGTGRKPRGADR
ncbi:MAG TPA: alpha/beta hydrolase [Actinomycetota bacterium]